MEKPMNTQGTNGDSVTVGLPKLRSYRHRVGPESQRGRILSNLDQQAYSLNDPDPRPWATHPMQSVQGMMKWQVECLTTKEK